MLILGEEILFSHDLIKIINDFESQTTSQLFFDYTYNDVKIVDDKYKFYVIAKNIDDLKIILEFFSKFELVDNQMIILKFMDINNEDLEGILEEFSDCSVINRLYMDIAYDKSGDFIDFDDLVKMRLIIDQVKKIIPDDASNLEIITYVYNWLKQREYKHNFDNPNLSKYYSSALITEYIVCVGFTKVFNNVLSEYGICASEYEYHYVENKIDKGHDISIVRVQDDKYGVDGLYFFDLTRDCCYNNNIDNKHNYYGFMMTYDKIIKQNISKDMLNKMLLFDENNLINTIDEIEPEFNKLTIDDDVIIDSEEDYRKKDSETMQLIYNIMRMDYDLFKDIPSVNLVYISNPFGAMYYIYKYILFIKQHLGIKIDEHTIIDLLINTNPNQKPGYYLYSTCNYSSNPDNFDLENHCEYIKKKLATNK